MYKYSLTILLYAFTTYGVDQRVPGFMRQWIEYEQEHFATRSGNPEIMAGLRNHQKKEFSPQAGNVFPLETYWVDEDLMEGIEGEGLSQKLRRSLVRTKKGRKQYRLIVHPESKKFYDEVIKQSEKAENLMATATASSRTLLVWPPEKPQEAFFAKLSLDKVIGQVRRTIKNSEAAGSVGVHNMIQEADLEIPDGAHFLPEEYGLVFKGEKRGGMIVRSIPANIKSGRHQFIPFFAFYTDSSKGKKAPLLQLLQATSESPQSFIEEKILKPYIKQWVQLVVDAGMSAEDHAQNLLIGVDSKGMPNGTFLRRDFGGFNFDLNYLDARGVAMPELPVFSSLYGDYHQHRNVGNIEEVIKIYFTENILYDIDQRVHLWQRKGLVMGPKIKVGDLKKRFFENLEKELRERLKTTRPKSKRIKDLVAAARREKLSRKLRPRALQKCLARTLYRRLDRISP